jgi:arylsulfatase A-like enzyme
MRLPSMDNAVRCDAFVGNVDIMPTLLAACGLDIPPTCVGRNLLPVVHGEAPPREAIVTHSEVGQATRIRTRDWAYVFRREDGSDQLYDLKADPLELDNLAREAKHAAAREAMQRRLLAFYFENTVRFPAKTYRTYR